MPHDILAFVYSCNTKGQICKTTLHAVGSTHHDLPLTYVFEHLWEVTFNESNVWVPDLKCLQDSNSGIDVTGFSQTLTQLSNNNYSYYAPHL